MKRSLAILLAMLTVLSIAAIPVFAESPTLLRPYDPTLDTTESDEDVGFFITVFATLFGIGLFSAILGILTTAALLLLAVAVIVITLVGCLRLNRRYRELTGQSTTLLNLTAIILSLFGLGALYLVVMALVNHSKI